MRIALVRHFRVITGSRWKIFFSGSEFDTWMKDYDLCGVAIPKKAAIPAIPWSVCYSSEADRAVTTASCLYSGQIIRTPLLREIPICPVFKGFLKLPLYLWFALGRIGWFFGWRSQPENRVESRKRIEQFLSIVEEGGHPDVLVVCHGGLMLQFKSVLRDRGLRGRGFLYPENGKLYIFESQGSGISLKTPS